jgi:DNA-binding MarR family transcriptional regulator
MVAALDEIAARMIAVAPVEGIGGGAPLRLQEIGAARTIPLAGAVTMSQLANSIGVSLPTATHLVDRLVAKGVAVRIRPEHDRRLVLVALSEETKAYQQAFLKNRVQLILDFLKSLAPTEREQVARALREIARITQSWPGTGGGSSAAE